MKINVNIMYYNDYVMFTCRLICVVNIHVYVDVLELKRCILYIYVHANVASQVCPALILIGVIHVHAVLQNVIVVGL